VAANLDQHLAQIKAAKAQDVNLLLFPELSLTGYNLQDLVYEVAMRPTEDYPAFKALMAASVEYDMDVMVGFVDRDDRARYYIGAAYLSQGKCSTSITKSTCRPTPCSTKGAILPGAIRSRRSIPGSGGSGC
jgi:predicted amidohydrolase